MATLNGWINVIDGSSKTDSLFEGLDPSSVLVNRVFMNGNVCYQFYISHNHKGASFNLFFDILGKLVEVEHPETHGVIYLIDDEDPVYNDTWQVWVIRHGVIEQTRDTYLSPFSEKVGIYDDD